MDWAHESNEYSNQEHPLDNHPQAKEILLTPRKHTKAIDFPARKILKPGQLDLPVYEQDAFFHHKDYYPWTTCSVSFSTSCHAFEICYIFQKSKRVRNYCDPSKTYITIYFREFN